MKEPPPPPPNALAIARAAAEEAGRMALEAFRRPKNVTVKGRGNLLTETDLQIERFLHDAFRRAFPDIAILSEETASDTPIEGWVWAIDPLDGTKNFVSGIPFFCVNIALCYDGAPVVGVTYDPNHNECFWAEREGGARINEEPMHASDKLTVLESVVGVDIGYDDQRGAETLEMLRRLFPGAQAFRVPGSAALGLAYAACGRYDIFVHRYLFPWDIAAGILLIQQAGGVVTDDAGQPIGIMSKTVIGGGPLVHKDFVRWQMTR
jgi:fructose-1,6-bisphosphatase/inositol monophosphatase family enzyme